MNLRTSYGDERRLMLALDTDGWPVLIGSHPLAAAIRLMKDLSRTTLYGSPGYRILNRAGRHLLEQWLELRQSRRKP